VGGTFVIDCFPESALRYRDTHAAVVVDVFRFCTTAVTALEQGRRVFPVRDTDEGAVRAAELDDPLLVGELGGNRPYGWDLNNSPSELAARTDRRPVVLLSSSGARLLANCRGARATYLACFRNAAAVAALLAAHHPQVALLGAGTRGTFRREDQMGCARVGRQLLRAGYAPADERTRECVARWGEAPVPEAGRGRSAEYLERSGQGDDIAYVLDHVDDAAIVPRLEGIELLGAG